MAERVAQGRAAEEGLTGVTFNSSGVSDEEHGGPIDEHGASHGYSEIDYNAGMRLDELHAKFPHLTLIGNVDSAQILSRGTAADVRRHSQEVLEAGAGIRHIYGISNSVMPETPVENFLAMHEVHDAFKVPEPVKA